MIKDTNLQTITPYITHVQSDGSNIGGVNPADYGITPIFGTKSAQLLRTVGNTDPLKKKYPAWLWSLHPRPILTKSGRFQLTYRFMVSPTMAGANVWETDTILILTCMDGVKRKFNLSLQRHVATGQIDIGNWTDTGLRAGPIIPNIWHTVVIQYAYDVVKNVCSVVSYTCDGVTLTVPQNLCNMPATVSNWDEGAIPQAQMGSLPSGTAWVVALDKWHYIWQ